MPPRLIGIFLATLNFAVSGLFGACAIGVWPHMWGVSAAFAIGSIAHGALTVKLFRKCVWND